MVEIQGRIVIQPEMRYLNTNVGDSRSARSGGGGEGEAGLHKKSRIQCEVNQRLTNAKGALVLFTHRSMVGTSRLETHGRLLLLLFCPRVATRVTVGAAKIHATISQSRDYEHVVPAPPSPPMKMYYR